MILLGSAKRESSTSRDLHSEELAELFYLYVSFSQCPSQVEHSEIPILSGWSISDCICAIAGEFSPVGLPPDKEDTGGLQIGKIP